MADEPVPVRRIYITGKEIYVSKPGVDALVAARENGKGLLLSMRAKNYQAIYAGYKAKPDTSNINRMGGEATFTFTGTFPTQPVIPEFVAEIIFQGEYWANNPISPRYELGPFYDYYHSHGLRIDQSVTTTGFNIKIKTSAYWTHIDMKNQENSFGLSWFVFRKRWGGT